MRRAFRRISLTPDIADRIRDRDAAAFDELIHVAGPALISFGASYVHSREIAEDIVQEVLFRLYQLGPRFVPQGSVETYLFAAVRNEALGVLRKEGVRNRYANEYAVDVMHDVRLDTTGSVDDIFDEERIMLRRALSRLTEHQRTAFHLRYGAEMTISEIANILSISPKGAERLMTRLKHLLREYIMGDEESDRSI